jgi:hypothetical protein
MEPTYLTLQNLSIIMRLEFILNSQANHTERHDHTVASTCTVLVLGSCMIFWYRMLMKNWKEKLLRKLKRYYYEWRYIWIIIQYAYADLWEVRTTKEYTWHCWNLLPQQGRLHWCDKIIIVNMCITHDIRQMHQIWFMQLQQSLEIKLSSLELQVRCNKVCSTHFPPGHVVMEKWPHGPKAIGSNLLALLIRTQILAIVSYHSRTFMVNTKRTSWKK